MHRYTVVIVGPRGSGKTVFLGSMYRQLSVQGSHGFFLEVSDQQKRELIAIYSTVATGEEWPNATATTKEWKFKCNVRSPSRKIYTAFEMSYYDYSGGRVTDPNKDDPDFQALLDKADCLLGLLDGQKIFHHMEGSDKGQFQFVDLPNILSILEKSSNPVHLVVSKWDLLEGRYTLDQVRQRLLEDDVFRNLATTRSHIGVPVRLIPVSSVGTGFAEWNSNGHMKKQKGKTPRPFQVETPFALVLPDKMRAELNRLIREEARKRASQIQVDPNLSAWDRLGLVFGGAVRLVREYMPPQYQFSETILRKIAERSELSARQKREQAARKAQEQRDALDQSLQSVEDEKTALDFALKSFENIEMQLDYGFPSSEIVIPRR